MVKIKTSTTLTPMQGMFLYRIGYRHIYDPNATSVICPSNSGFVFNFKKQYYFGRGVFGLRGLTSLPNSEINYSADYLQFESFLNRKQLPSE
jgi:hypothetical protein